MPRHLRNMIGSLVMACAAMGGAGIAHAGPDHAAPAGAVSGGEAYPPIADESAARLVERGLAAARQLLGEPRLPVASVVLRQSTPRDAHSTLPRDFQLCELTDANRGAFTIYLARRPGDYAFAGQLAHELAHLLNAQLYDAYVEGLNTAFAERFLKQEGKDWSGWKKYLATKDPFYGSTYALMNAIWELVGDAPMKSLLAFAVFTDAAHTKMHIDITRWIATLPADQQPKVRTLITTHANSIQQAIHNRPEYHFAVPQ